METEDSISRVEELQNILASNDTRPRNDGEFVILLENHIKVIQEECDHNWKADDLDPKELKEQSALEIKGQTIYDLTWVVKYTVICSKCGAKKTVRVNELCPFCLEGVLKVEEEIDEAQWGFGQYGNRVLRIYQCDNCKTMIFDWYYTI